MTPLTVPQLRQRFQALSAQKTNGQLSSEAFVREVHKLQAQDHSGAWWTIDPHNGEYLKYVQDRWTPAVPPAVPSAAPSASPGRSAPARSPGGCLGCLASPVIVGLLSFGAAAVWFVYTSLSPSSEGWDPWTTMLIGGLPLGLRLFQKPIDRLLAPLAALRRQVPGALLTGAAFGLPFVVGLFCALPTGGGYGALRFSILVSILGSYALSRKPRLF